MRYNPKFHGQQRSDCVIIHDDTPKLSVARLCDLFRYWLPSGNTLDIALIQRLSSSKWKLRTMWDGCRVLDEELDTTLVQMDYLLRGALICPVSNPWDDDDPWNGDPQGGASNKAWDGSNAQEGGDARDGDSAWDSEAAGNGDASWDTSGDDARDDNSIQPLAMVTPLEIPVAMTLEMTTVYRWGLDGVTTLTFGLRSWKGQLGRITEGGLEREWAERGVKVLTWIKASLKVQTSRQGEQWRKYACQQPVEQDLVLRTGLPWGQSDSDMVHVECVVGTEDTSIIPGLPLRRSHPTEWPCQGSLSPLGTFASRSHVRGGHALWRAYSRREFSKIGSWGCSLV